MSKAHPHPLKKERTLHEPQIEILIKRELMAKAGICIVIVHTSLKAGAKFEKNIIQSKAKLRRSLI